MVLLVVLVVALHPMEIYLLEALELQIKDMQVQM
jgi:hypothetical protein